LAAVPSIGRASAVEARPAHREAHATSLLYERYARQIFNFCLHRLGNREEAEDAAQTTFLNAFRGIQRGVTPEIEQAWLFKIAENVCLTRHRSTFRRRRVESPSDLDVVQEVVPSPPRDAETLIRLSDALAEMSDQQRRALLLREWQGLSYREIAEELELSQPAVETLLFRARRSLANGLTETPGRKRRARLRAGFDVFSIVLAFKAAFGGGGAVKIAAVAAVASTTAIAGTKVESLEHAKTPVASHKSAPAAVSHGNAASPRLRRLRQLSQGADAARAARAPVRARPG
jgi:RNA polymerase sigma factor (sigma-70 family)